MPRTNPCMYSDRKRYLSRVPYAVLDRLQVHQHDPGVGLFQTPSGLLGPKA